MAALEEKLSLLLSRANMDAGPEYEHFLTEKLSRGHTVHIPPHVVRAVSQARFAYHLSAAKGGLWHDLVESAVDELLAAMREEGAITRAAARRAEEMLMPLSEASKQYTAHMVAHAHIDMNWQWPYHETVAVTLETFRTVLALMKEFPRFTYAQSQASTYRIVEQYEPEMLEEIKARVREGRWEVSASTWVEADKNMPCAESMARHLLYTKNYLSKLLDIPPESLNLDFEPDTFGHSENVPEILSQGGVKYYYYCRGRMGAGAHIWRAPSGAQVLAYQEPTWYLGDVNPAFAMYVPEFCENTGVHDYLKVYGVGDHGGGPTRQDLSYIEEMQTWPVFPRVIYSSYRAFFAALEGASKPFDVVTGEINCVFSGCYTTQCRIKAANRQSESALGEAEALCALANALTGRAYKRAAFEKSWRDTLFSQFHDILPGSCVRDSREYALAAFSNTMALAGTEYAAAMRAIAENIDTSMIPEKGAAAFTRAEGAGVGFDSMRFCPPVAERCASLTRVFHIFNPAPEARDGLAEVTVWDYPGDTKSLYARNAAGNLLETQLLSPAPLHYMGHTYTRALVKTSVPALGWTTVVLDASPAAGDCLPYPRDPRRHFPEAFALENEYLRAEFHDQSGMLVSLREKESGRELLRAPAGFYEILEDPSHGMTSWRVGRYIRRAPIDQNVRLALGEAGGLKNSVTLTADFGTGSRLECEISLCKGERHLRFQTKCDWRERGCKEAGIVQLAFAAPLNYAFDRARCDVPAGSVDRACANMDVPVGSYLCALREDGAPAIVLTTDCKYGMRAFDNTLQVTLIRAGFQPDPDPENGAHAFCVSLGATKETAPDKLAAFCQAIHRPLRYISMRPHAGPLAATGEWLRVDCESARLESVKMAEDGQALVVRIVNYADAARAMIESAIPMERACVSDALEGKGETLPVKENTCAVPLRAHSLTTLRIRLAKP